MALVLEKEVPSGVTGSYWRVVQLNVNYLLGVANVTVALFLSSTARREGKAPLYLTTFEWKGDDFIFAADQAPVPLAYQKLKTTKLLVNAADA
jgi:hypothetical protein